MVGLGLIYMLGVRIYLIDGYSCLVNWRLGFFCFFVIRGGSLGFIECYFLFVFVLIESVIFSFDMGCRSFSLNRL